MTPGHPAPAYLRQKPIMPRFLRTPGRRALRPLPWILAFLLPPVLVGYANVRRTMEGVLEAPPPPPPGALPAFSPPDPGRPLAVVLAGDGYTEATDLLAPYELLARSGAYQVYILARERKPLALFPGRLDILPHLTFQDWEELVEREPDLIVLPYMQGGDETAHGELETWLRRRWTASNTLVTICGGSWVAAAAGVLEGREATSHRNVLRLVEDGHPEVAWTSGVRYVDDGNLISSAGITSGIDAVLHFLAREHGESTARRVAREVGYPHLDYLEDPAFDLPRGTSPTRLLNMAFSSGPRVGLLLTDGASELHLAALTDTYPRSFISQLLPMAVERRYIETRHGLHLVPRWEIGDVPSLHRLILAGTPEPDERVRMESWIPDRDLDPEPLETGVFPYDRFLQELARDLGPATARHAAVGLEYPIAGAAVGTGGLPTRPLGTGILLGLLGLGAAYLLRGALEGRWSPRSPRPGRGSLSAFILAAMLGAAALPSPVMASGTAHIHPYAPRDSQGAEAPFRIEVVKVTTPGAVLTGRLFLPEGAGPRPAALLLAGARDSRNLPGLAEHLAGLGLVVLDLDKRGVGGSSGNWKGESLTQRSEDAHSAFRFLEGHPEVDSRRIGVVGHSQGAYVAPLLAGKAPSVAFVVLLAGPGEPVRDQVLTHRRIILEREGLSPEAVEGELRGLRRELGMASRFRPVCRALRLSYVCGMIHHDPAPWLEGLQAPVLALFTAFDEMAPPEPNADLVREALARGGNPDATIHVFPEGCHEFMSWDGPGTSMGPGYLPGFLELLGDWVGARVELPERRSPTGEGALGGGDAPPSTPKDGAHPSEEAFPTEVAPFRDGARPGAEGRRLLLPLPILFRAPETGWAAGGAVMRVHWPASGPIGHPLPSTDEISVVYTQRGQFMAGLGTDRHLDGGRLHVFGSLSASHYPAHFHGIGRDLSPDRYEMYTARTTSVHAGFRREVRPGIRGGGGIQVTRHQVLDIRSDGERGGSRGSLEGGTIPGGSLDPGTLPGSRGGTVAALSLAAGVDTRDRAGAPLRGSWGELRIRGAGDDLAGDFTFSQLTLDGRRYLPLAGEHVLALQLFATTTWGDVPFQELPTMGGPHVMRGYHPSLHRDRSVVSGQVEYRTPFLWRMGAVAFAGVGATGGAWPELRPRDLRLSGGAGLRFALDRDQRLNLRADFGVGRRSSALYLGIREAF